MIEVKTFQVFNCQVLEFLQQELQILKIFKVPTTLINVNWSSFEVWLEGC